MSGQRRRSTPALFLQAAPDDNPGAVHLTKLSPDEHQRLTEAIRRREQRRGSERVRVDVPDEVLDGLVLGDWFVVRVHREHLHRVRLGLQRAARIRGWYLSLEEDPTASPPAGFVDMYGYVEERATYDELGKPAD